MKITEPTAKEIGFVIGNCSEEEIVIAQKEIKRSLIRRLLDWFKELFRIDYLLLPNTYLMTIHSELNK